MKIIMIRPNIGMLTTKNGKDVPFDDQGRMEPLQLGVLAGITPSDIDVKLVDDRLEEIDYDEPVDLVAISVEIFTARRGYEIADTYKDRQVPVVLGGVHVTSMPEEALTHADTIVKCDAEQTWPQLIEDFKRGVMKRVYESVPGVGQSGHFPRRSIYKNKKYLSLSLLQFGRGCPYVCSFCSTGEYFKGQYYHRDVQEVIDEIKEQKRKFLFFTDDNIIADNEKAKELFRVLIPLKLRWVGQASVDMTNDIELMTLMGKSGCLGLVIGFESISPEGLKAYNKKPNDYHRYIEQIKIIRKHGIYIWAAFLLGHDNETFETLKKTLDFAIEQKFGFAAFNLLMPYPGTQVYKRLESQNRLLYDGKWWLSDKYRFNYAAYKPANMTAQELTDYCFYMRRKYNSTSMMLKRLFSRQNLLNFRSFSLLASMIALFTKETLKKQGMHLGYFR